MLEQVPARTAQELRDMKQLKVRLKKAAELFNEKPKKGLAHLQELGLLPDPLEPGPVASFLRKTKVCIRAHTCKMYIH